MARDYGKVLSRFWTSGSGARLRDDRDARLAAVYLFTCPSANAIGIYYLPIPTLAFDLGLTVKQAGDALSRVESEGIASYDGDHALAWVPEMARVSLGEHLAPNDKRRFWVLKELRAHERHPFYGAFLDRYGAPYSLGLVAPPEVLTSPLVSPFDGPSLTRARQQQQEQEQEQEQKQAKATSPNGSSPAKSVLVWWCEQPYHERKPKLTPKRLARVMARLAEGFTEEDLRAAILHAAHDPWLMGTDPKSTKAFKDVETILRDAAQVERLRDLTAPKRSSGNGHARKDTLQQPGDRSAPDDWTHRMSKEIL